MAAPELARIAERLFYAPAEADVDLPHPLVIDSVTRLVLRRAGVPELQYDNFSIAAYDINPDVLEMSVKHMKKRPLSFQPLYGKVCLVLCNEWRVSSVEYIIPSQKDTDELIFKRVNCIDITDLMNEGEIPPSPHAGRYPIPDALPVSRAELCQLESLLSFEQTPARIMAV